ncbi:MAG: hypothetical protein K0Q52_170 [Microbacterium sp.]|jgi:hypothetical protein|nr:hypothetical protein [Microbacterium sp.]
MTLKTPEQIAHETWGEGTGFHRGSGEAVVEMMAAAIEVDRAQEFDTARAIADEEFGGYSGHIAHMRWVDFEQSLRTVASRAFRAGRIAEQSESAEKPVPAAITDAIEADFPTDEPGVYVPHGGQRGEYFDAIAVDFSDGQVARHYSLSPEGDLTVWQVAA